MSASEKHEGEQRPECRVPATFDPNGMLQFGVSEEQARHIYEQVKEDFEAVDDDGFVPVKFVMERPAYGDVVDGLEEIESQLPRVGAKPVQLAIDPEYTVTVVLDAEQITSTLESNREALENSGGGDSYTQVFRISKKAAILVIRQFEEAFDGAEDPVEAIDINSIRKEMA